MDDSFYPSIPEIVYKTEFSQNIHLNSPISNPEIAKSELCWNVKALCRMGGFSDLEFQDIIIISSLKNQINFYLDK